MKRSGRGPQRVVVTAIIVALLIGVGLVLASRNTADWSQEFQLNLGFLVLEALFTVLIVDRILQWHEDRTWSGSRSIALVRVRRIATRMLSNLSIYHTNKDRALDFTVPWSAVREDPLNYDRLLHEDPKWIIFIEGEVMPNAVGLVRSLDADQIDHTLSLLETYVGDLQGSALLFANVLSPSQVENMTAIIDQMPMIIGALRGQRRGVINFPFADLEDIIRRSLNLVKESNQSKDASLPLLRL